MHLSELSFDGAQPPIDSYAPGGFRIRGRFVTGPILLSAEGAAAWPAEVETGSLIDTGRLRALLALSGDVDVLLIGMGAEMARLFHRYPGAIRRTLQLQQPTFGGHASRSAVASQTTAGCQHAMAGNHQRYAVSRHRLPDRSRRPDILIDVELGRVNALEFHKLRTVLEAAEPAKRELREKLNRVLQAETVQPVDVAEDVAAPDRLANEVGRRPRLADRLRTWRDR